jgi:hypothetical protein
MDASLLIYESLIEIPFTTDLTIVYGDGTQVVKGVKSGTFQVKKGRTVTKYGEPIPI